MLIHFWFLFLGVKGISKILTTETIQYPDIKALELSSFFIPKTVFRNTDIVEYRDGKYTYITGSKYQSTLVHNEHLDFYAVDKNQTFYSMNRKRSNRKDDGPLIPYEPNS